MRRVVLLASGAVVAGAPVGVMRSRGASSARGPGVLPGCLGKRLARLVSGSDEETIVAAIKLHMGR